MLRLTERSFRGQVLRAHICCVCVCVLESERESYSVCMCVCVCVCPCVCILLTWNQSCGVVIMILAPFPEGSSLTAPGRDCKLPHFCLERESFPQTCGWHHQKLGRRWGFVFVVFFFLPRWREQKSYLHLSLRCGGGVDVCLSESLGFLTRGWTLCTVRGPWNLSGW